jgi:hypothetical protein
MDYLDALPAQPIRFICCAVGEIEGGNQDITVLQPLRAIACRLRTMAQVVMVNTGGNTGAKRPWNNDVSD